MKKYLPYILLLLAFSGMIDAGYLTIEHYNASVPPCYDVPFSDCGQVLTSKYSTIFGIPVALFGVFHYISFLIILVYAGIGNRKRFTYLAVISGIVGFVASVYFVFLQLFVLQAICTYCMVSALISFTLFFLTQKYFYTPRKHLGVIIFGILYTHLFKKILFLFDPEQVHETITSTSAFFGSIPIMHSIAGYAFDYKNPVLRQKISEITFQNPVGLAAGFDYEGQLTQILPRAGFGYQSIGTITNLPYAGNPRPMLGRLPKSRSLMVNKGFKNPGANTIIDRLNKNTFTIPVGISIGQTNSKKGLTQKEAVADIIACFTKFEKSQLSISYYELNISCPNLNGNVSFYPPKELETLLKAIDTLQITTPIFVKMPIDQTNKQTQAMLEVIAKHSPVGVIFGNLQSDKNNKAFVQSEVSQFPIGKFSGKPTYNRSNELIRLTYKKYKKRFVIIGLGGIFSAEDAYEKIQSGASLVQLITGMIFQGPGLIAEINIQLAEFVKRDGYTSITQAIGTKK